VRTRLGDDEGYAGTSGPAANANDLAARRRPGHHVVRFFGPRVGERDRVGPPAALAPDSVDPSPDRLTGRQLTAATIFSRLGTREVIPASGARRFGSESSGHSRRSMPASRIRRRPSNIVARSRSRWRTDGARLPDASPSGQLGLRAIEVRVVADDHLGAGIRDVSRKRSAAV